MILSPGPRVLTRSLFTLALLSLTTSGLLAQSSVLVVDAYNRKVHVANEANTKRAVGGLAKIATAMVALDWAEASKAGVNILATVPPYALNIAGIADTQLQPGDQVTLRDLLYSTMMTGDNVAAITLGHFVGADLLMRMGRQGDPLGEFVKQMNQLAAREGAKNTRFMNPHGFENTRPLPYSTAADMARLSLYAASRSAFRFYTNQKSRSVTIYRAGGSQKITLRNTNPLLGTDRIDGIKASATPAAAGCMVLTAEKPSSVIKQGGGNAVVFRHKMIVVVIGSANPSAEGRSLLYQGWSAYDQWLNAGRPVTDKRQMLTYF
jgi:D-alanyl-D-alanine carboxypeptidase